MEQDGVDSSADAPLTLLSEINHPTSTRFLPGVRERIERRLLISQLTAGAWFFPVVVLLEFIGVGMGLFTKSDPPNPSGSR